MKATLNRVYLPLIAIVISVFFVQCSGDKVNFILKQTAIEANKSFPAEIDESTTLDSCQALPNKILRYYYTLAGEEPFSDEEIPILELYQRKQLISEMQQNPSDYKILVDINTTIQYAYYNEKGKEIALITVTPEQYNRIPDMQSDEYV